MAEVGCLRCDLNFVPRESLNPYVNTLKFTSTKCPAREGFEKSLVLGKSKILLGISSFGDAPSGGMIEA